MVTVTLKLAPTPATLRHVIPTSALVTAHDEAVYTPPYDADHNDDGVVVGPKPVPLITITADPVVGIDDPDDIDTAVTTGAAYDDTTDAVTPLDKPPTVTFHAKLTPTPATVVH